jgi:putative phage-type endonuclease
MSDEKRPTDTIGGTDIAQIIGVSPYGGPIDVYRSMVEKYEKPQTAPMTRGLRFEPVIRAMYEEETGAKLRPGKPGIARLPKYGFAHASPDDFATRDGSEVLCEWKTAGTYTAKAWGTEADEIPLPYLCQVQWGMTLTNMVAADVAVLIGVDDFRHFRIIRDAELCEMLFTSAEKFYRDHILTKRAPDPDASDSYGEWLKARYPESRGLTLDATPELDAVAKALQKARADLKDAEAREKEARNRLCAFIGDADGVAGTDWKVTWRMAKSAARVDWKAVATEAGADETIIQRHTSIAPSGRRFLPKFAGASDE